MNMICIGVFKKTCHHLVQRGEMIASTNDSFSLFFVAKLAVQSEINSLDLGNQTSSCIS
jgi:hypothetical protein